MRYDDKTLSIAAAGHFDGTGDVALHMHHGVELVYVSRGHCTCATGEQSVEAFAGEMMILPAGVPHEQTTHERTATVYLEVCGGEAVISDAMRTVELRDPRPLRWMEDLIAARDGRAPLPGECCAALATALLRAVGAEDADGQARHPAVAAAMECMRGRLDDASLSLDDVAEAAGVSPSHLSQLFREDLRCSPMRTLERLRMERARQMLSAPYDPVKHIARVCGYNDASYFCRAFRRRTGQSPGEFRRDQRAC